MLDKDQIESYLQESLWKHRGKFSEHQHEKALKIIRERTKHKIIANLNDSRYELVRKSVEESGFLVKNTEDFSDAFLIWTDNFLPLERLMTLKPYQRINHFPGMVEITRKDFLAKNLSRMQRLRPRDYDFMPRTWVLPKEHGYFQKFARTESGSRSSFILKPANGAMGHGIRLHKSAETVPANPMNGVPCVVQKYISNPLLIDGYKFDLRVYVLVTSCDPLRIFMFKNGLVRLTTEPYVEPNRSHGDSLFIHLTNYAVNKHHFRYNRSSDENVGSKRSFYFLDQYLRQNLSVDPSEMWRKIRELIVKTIILATPHLLHTYRLCRLSGSSSLISSSVSANNHKRQSQSMHIRDKEPSSCSMCTRSDEPGSNLHESHPVRHHHRRGFDKRMADRSSSQPRRPFRLAAKSTIYNNSSGPSLTYSSFPSASSHSILVPRKRSNCSHTSSFFEILGFDILLDNELKPWLIEVNRSPSFNGDQELDRQVKLEMLRDTIRLLNIRPSDKARMESEQKFTSCRRLYTPYARATLIRERHLSNRASKLKYSRQLSLSDAVSTCTVTNHHRSRPLDQMVNTYSGYQPISRKVERQVNNLYQQLLVLRQRNTLEFFEHHNSGNWSLIFPTDDGDAQALFASLILTIFKEFHNGRPTDLIREIEQTYVHPTTEEDILNKIKSLAYKHLQPLSCSHRSDRNHSDIPCSEWNWIFASEEEENYKATSSDVSTNDWSSTLSSSCRHRQRVRKSRQRPKPLEADAHLSLSRTISVGSDRNGSHIHHFTMPPRRNMRNADQYGTLKRPAPSCNLTNR